MCQISILLHKYKLRFLKKESQEEVKNQWRLKKYSQKSYQTDPAKVILGTVAPWNTA